MDTTSALTIVVEPAPHPLGHRFAVHAATGAGWRGGDSAIGIDCAGHQRLWLFSDTLLPGRQWVHNCVVVEDTVRRELRTVHGGTPSSPQALVGPPSETGPDGRSRWLWAGHGVALDGPEFSAEERRVRVFYQEFAATAADGEAGEWDFAWVRTVVVELSVPDLRVLSRSPVEDGTGVQWGVAVHRDGEQLLVYGVADEGEDKHLLLATTTVDGGPWRYRTVDGWSPRPQDAARLLTGVSNEISVLPLPDPDAGWLLVTSDTRHELGSWPVVAYRACDPGGPWSGPQLLLDPPENHGSCYAYNPTLMRIVGDRYLLAYNVNSTLAEVRADPSVYRPRWRQVQIGTAPHAAT